MKNILYTILFSGLISHGILAQEIKKEKYNAGPWEDNIGYAQAVKVGNTLYLSGHVSDGTFEEQVEQVYKSIEKTLAQFGATFQNVVKENLYTTDIEEMKKHNAIRLAFYKKDFPAATWVQIERLYLAEAKLEVELIAILPDKSNE